MVLQFYNTLTRRKEAFTPIDKNNVCMYVCGPTVYDRPHLGNARSVVVYDVLFRLLKHIYGEKHVTYVRNITDVDDKINARAKERGITIRALTDEVTAQFYTDMEALGCAKPTLEPRATEHIADMHRMIQQLINGKHAYVKDGHVLFDVASVKHYAPDMGNEVTEFVYGMLSHRVQDELVAGARVQVESYKKNPGDFVLWKPAEPGDDPSSVFDSPWGRGRPGWHIECSAMSVKHLGDSFDIHGGGSDLMFPHHENEIAQSRCANPKSQFARYWVHNGFLTVNGEKMSKSLGNFITVRDLLDKGMKGEVIRLALLSSKYNEPLDWSDKLVEDAKKTLDKWYRILDRHSCESGNPSSIEIPASAGMTEFIDSLSDDMNLPKAISTIHQMDSEDMVYAARLLGFLQQDSEEWFKGKHITNTVKGTIKVSDSYKVKAISEEESIEKQIDARISAKKAKNWAEADRIRKELADQGIILEDRPDGTTDWRRT